MLIFYSFLYEQMDNIITGINEGDSMLTTVLYHMGALFHGLGKFNDALRVHERCLKILEKEFGKFHCCLIFSEICFMCLDHL
jgi:hypothetical protein